MTQRYKFSIESKSFPLDISGEPQEVHQMISIAISAPNNLHSNKCIKEFILFTSLKCEKVRLRLMRNLTFYFLYV